MVDSEEREKNPTRGNEWEVVSLTASAYAAAPATEQIEMNEDDKSNTYGAETSRALFMSGHFVFPPSQHENLPLEPDKSEIHDEEQGEEEDLGFKFSAQDRETEDLEESKFFDEKDNMISLQGDRFIEGDNDIQQEQIAYGSYEYSSFHGETAFSSGSTKRDESITNFGQIEPSEQGTSISPEIFKSSKVVDKGDKSDLPCGAWWKRRAAFLYKHAKEANTFWSIFIAAAVMGLVILGQHWQQERWQTMQLKWHASLNDQKTSKLLGPIIRLKDVIVGGQRRASFIRSSSASEI